MGKTILIAMAGLGLFAAIAPNLGASHGGDPARFAQDSGLTAPGIGTSDSSSNGSGDRASDDGLVLDRRSDGHFYADVELNGTSVEMMVDTGASAIALSGEDARRAGVATSIGMSDVVGEGAGGEVYGDVVKLDRVRLGDAKQEGVTAVVLKGGQTSLLGQSFLREFDSVRIEGDRMILR